MHTTSASDDKKSVWTSGEVNLRNDRLQARNDAGWLAGTQDAVQQPVQPGTTPAMQLHVPTALGPASTVYSQSAATGGIQESSHDYLEALTRAAQGVRASQRSLQLPPIRELPIFSSHAPMNFHDHGLDAARNARQQQNGALEPWQRPMPAAAQYRSREWSVIKQQDQPPPAHQQPQTPAYQRIVSDISHTGPLQASLPRNVGFGVAASRVDHQVGQPSLCRAPATGSTLSPQRLHVHQPHHPATPASASRRDSQSPTPTSRRRSSARKTRSNRPLRGTSHDPPDDNPETDRVFSRSQLDRRDSPNRYAVQSQLLCARLIEGASAAASAFPSLPAHNYISNETSPSRRITGSMASGGAKWREEQILIICPGSRTTMAQLGCSELTPPAHRIPTRMFRDGNEWRPYYTYKRTKTVGGEEQEEWVEDVDEDKGAVFPIEGGRIVNMDAFLAFLDHVHGLLTTTYHNTPIMLMASPQWTRPDCEAIAQYIFERTRTPALCMIHSGIATQYGLKWPNMTVIDIGYEKVDVTAIHDGRVVNHMDVGAPGNDRQISGGEVFTRRLMKLLQSKEFSHDMAEQLKKSTICEVLPYAAGEDALMELPKESPAPAAAPSDSVSPELTKAELSRPQGQAGGNNNGGEDGENGEANGDDDGVLDVASIVTSGQTKEFLAKKEKEKSTRGRKPKDKEADAAPAKPVRLPNAKRTYNTFAFEEIVMEEVVPEPVKVPEVKAPAPVPASAPVPEVTNGVAGEGAMEGVKTETNGDTPAPTEVAPSTETEAHKPAEESEAAKPSEGAKPAESAPSESAPAEKAPAETASAPETEIKPAEESTPTALPFAADTNTNTTPELRPKRVKRDVEVGIERFTFAERAEIDRIVTAIFRTIQGVDDMYMRPACWENLVFVGNGARLRGLKENILQTLSARHLVSPSTATMFTSELPSNVATPTGTGSQTPTGSYMGAPHQLSSSGVNPLLQAATTANAGAAAQGGVAMTPQAPGSEAAGPTQHHHFHSQTPTNIKTITFPNYLAEWTKNGFEEAMFLGAQVAARITFCLHSNMDAQGIEAQRQSSLSRVDYNELGPKGIRTHSMLS